MKSDTKSLFGTFEACFFCKQKVYVAGCEYMFQGQPVCQNCARVRKGVALMCTRTKPYAGVDPNWKQKALPGRVQRRA